MELYSWQFSSSSSANCLRSTTSGPSTTCSSLYSSSSVWAHWLWTTLTRAGQCVVCMNVCLCLCVGGAFVYSNGASQTLRPWTKSNRNSITPKPLKTLLSLFSSSLCPSLCLSLPLCSSGSRKIEQSVPPSISAVALGSSVMIRLLFADAGLRV